MIRFTAEIIINKPINEVFNYVTTVENFYKWNSAVLKANKITEGPISKNTSFIIERKLPTGLVQNIIEITDYSPNNCFTIQTESGPKPFIYSYYFTEDEARTTIKLIAKIKTTRLKIILSPLHVFNIKKGVKENFKTLKSILETN